MSGMKTIALSAALTLAVICPSLRAQTPSITVYTEYHASMKSIVSPEKKQSWQRIDLNVNSLRDGAVLSWRQWGGNRPDENNVHYDGTQGAVSELGQSAISDVTGYDPGSTFVGDDSKFLVTYKDAKTGDQVKESPNFVFAFNALAFSVPMDAQPKVLSLWAGAYACDGEMEVDLLSSAGQVLTSYSKVMTCPSPNARPTDLDRFYSYWRFRFHGTELGQTLRVQWQSLHHLQSSANVTLQAAALTSADTTSPAR